MRRLGLAAAIVMLIGVSVAQAGRAAPAATEIAYTHAGNVWLADATGANRREITTTGNSGTVTYPRYTWSPDGRYLLVVQRITGRRGPTRDTLFLYGARGGFVRSLGTVADVPAFLPGWAVDADRIAAIVRARPSHPAGASRYTVDSISISGGRRVLWSFHDGSGCDDNNPDPAEAVYAQETGFNGIVPTLQWSVAEHLAFFSANWCGTVDEVDTQTGRLRRLVDAGTGRPMDEVRMAPDGRSIVAHENAATAGPGSARDLLVTAPIDNPGYPLSIGYGELPAWSADGRTVYFVRRTPGRVLHAAMSDGLEVSFQTYSTAILSVGMHGYPLHRLVTLDAYGAGPPRMAPTAGSLLFSVVDNDWNLWRHRQSNGQYTLAELQQFGPRSRVVRFDPGRGLTTVASNAGRPAVQP